MKTINKEVKLKSVLIISCLLFTISGCSTMKTTNSGFLTKQVSTLNANSTNVSVSWHINNPQLITAEEQRSLTNKLTSSLKNELVNVHDTKKLSNIRIRAVVTRVETVSAPLNWLTTLIVFAPLDRGGVAVEFEAFDITTMKQVVRLNFAQWTPISEFTARFNRLAPAEIGMATAANAFITKLQKNL